MHFRSIIIVTGYCIVETMLGAFYIAVLYSSVSDDIGANRNV